MFHPLQQNCNASGMWSSGTTFITFDNVKVPKTNIIGKLNNGFMQAMYNFNHERCLFASRQRAGPHYNLSFFLSYGLLEALGTCLLEFRNSAC